MKQIVNPFLPSYEYIPNPEIIITCIQVIKIQFLNSMKLLLII